jgi:serine protease
MLLEASRPPRNLRNTMPDFPRSLSSTLMALLAIGAGASTPSAAWAGGPPQPIPAAASIVDTTDRLIVRLRDPLDADPAARIAEIATRNGEGLRRLRGMSGYGHVLQLQRMVSRSAAVELARRVAADPAVAFAEADLRMVPMRVPNDPMYANQWHYFEAAGGINLPAAWDRTVGSAAITVGVIDTGILNHVDLAGRAVAGYDFVTDATMAQDGDGRDADPSDAGDYGCNGSTSSWHGTHVAGTVGAATDNGGGVAGINWVSKIQPLRVLGRCGGYTSDIIDAMRWGAGIAVSGLPTNATPSRVLNLSLGGSGSCGTSLQNAINDVVARGTVVVVAAGNSNVDASGTSPAGCDNVVTVAATTRTGAKASYSNYGSKVTVAAPGGSSGGGVLSTLNAGSTVPAADSYAYYAGTSMATPHVAGVASLMLSLNPALTPAQVKAALASSARAFPAGTGDDCSTARCGAGIIDAAAALNVASPQPPATPPPTARANLVLPANGGTLSASSTYNAAYPPTGANNGDRRGANWAAGGGWNDASQGSYPDWLQADFSTIRTIAEIDVFTLQDAYTAPVEPTETLTFSQYGITDFEVQYWTGSTWQTVPGGSVTGNNKVWRRFTFAPVATTKIRVLVLGALAGFSRIAELEAYAGADTTASINFAAQANGGTAVASSTYSSAFPVSAVNDGDRRGLNWGAGGGWNDATAGAWTDAVQVGFAGTRRITEIDVVTIQDAYANPLEPTEATTFRQYGITAYDVQVWNGSAWVTVPGGSVTGNDKVLRKFTFPAVSTNAVRLVVNASLAQYSRIVEIEAWGTY